MALRTAPRQRLFLGPARAWVGFGSSEICLFVLQLTFSTNSIHSLALVNNYVPPVSDAPVDPALASVVSTCSSFPHTNDEAFFGC